ncbi:NUDIX hydrolase [uncultured Micrococcus sp.]|uniref:NUDIX hydrolase n=1 Tax=uncultured Micrococcus sp. TaxID=114051 RepID=UPI002597535E|nr:NUDIX hydrolase [uncultured Micrococcus sp.]
MPSSSTPRVASRSSDDHVCSAPTSDVVAAGALPWRLGADGLEVMLVHRPRYDDWSWPKGKLDAGETLPECAVREVNEEVGLAVTLGRPLAVTQYTLPARIGKDGGRSKEVWYWAADATGLTARPDGDEVDEVLWTTPDHARRTLSMASDVAPLDALVRAYEQQQLRTVPLLVLRHAKAKPRSSWSRAEEDRPLAATGRRQALAVARLTAVWRPEHLVSSPWRRCVETLSPLVKATGLALKYKQALTEAGAKKDSRKTRRVMRKLLDRRHPLLVCSHRPVLPLLFQEVARRAEDDAALRVLPDAEPFLRPGGVLVVHQGLDAGRRVVAVEVYDPAER